MNCYTEWFWEFFGLRTGLAVGTLRDVTGCHPSETVGVRGPLESGVHHVEEGGVLEDDAVGSCWFNEPEVKPAG